MKFSSKRGKKSGYITLGGPPGHHYPQEILGEQPPELNEVGKLLLVEEPNFLKE